MTVRWRLSVAAFQLLVLLCLSYLVTGRVLSLETWLLAAGFAFAINPLLVEPFFPRPGDIMSNAFVVLLLYMTADKVVSYPGWIGLLIVAAICFLFALFALVAGGQVTENKYSRISGIFYRISQFGKSQVLFSAAFLFDVIDFDSNFGSHFWILIAGWTGMMMVNAVNWQKLWSSASGQMSYATAEGMIGPSSILISAPVLAKPGTWVTISTKRVQVDGMVINRIRRVDSVWGQIYVDDQDACEHILTGEIATLSKTLPKVATLLGSVDAGSTDSILRFHATRPLEVGRVVCVSNRSDRPPILFQVTSAVIERLDVQGGSHLVTKASANQIGFVTEGEMKLTRHRWTPGPGAPVTEYADSAFDPGTPPHHQFLLGYVIGTKIPVYLDCHVVSEGHLAILGMTKMGKSTLAERLSKHLSQTRRVTVLDQTGEYVSKKGFPQFKKNGDSVLEPDIWVFEPQPSEIAPDRALDFLKWLVAIGLNRYLNGDDFRQTVIIDEAHQFIPEPAGLGFNAPGRESSLQIGQHIMQIRKYGISVILISQRTAVVSKSALSQCENIIAFRSVDQTGLDYLESVAGSSVRSLLPQLKQGEAVVFGPALSSETPIAIIVATASDLPMESN